MQESKTIRMPRYRKADTPPPMRFQIRDIAILQAIHDFDGVMTRRHLKTLFWPESSYQAMESRLSKLFHNGYLNWPDTKQRRTCAIPEPLVWLDWKGIQVVAAHQGIHVNRPAIENENQLRLFQARLRTAGIRWVREPNWNQLLHDVAVADFRLSLLGALKHTPHLELEKWVQESVFRAMPDVIQFIHKTRNGNNRKMSKGVCPDGLFVIADLNRAGQAKPHRARFLLEMDMATHDNPSFGIEKAAAGAAYIRSDLYNKRFDSNSGRWLVVTTGEVRLQNLVRQTKQQLSIDSDLFYFSTIGKILSNNLLRDPIWQQVGKAEQVALPFTNY